MKHLKKKKTYSQNRLIALRSKIGESSESSNLVSMTIAKGNCVIKTFKVESILSLSPANAKRCMLVGIDFMLKKNIKVKTNEFIVVNVVRSITIPSVLTKHQSKFERTMNVFMMNPSKV
jgi:hypothetical protein